MVIVTEFGCLVHEYVERCASLVFPRPSECPQCRVVDTLIGHGFYERKALSPTQAHVLRIKRWYCKACQRTISLLPSFVLRFRHYLLDVIQSVVVTRFEEATSWAQVARRCAIDGAPSSRTIRRWCDSLAEHASVWWAAIQQTLAEHDATSPMRRAPCFKLLSTCWPGPRHAGLSWRITAWLTGCGSCGTGALGVGWDG
jgi:transposase-like protein